jgi:hypothetical protein
MNSKLSRKIIVASGLAVVVGAVAVTVTLRSHDPTPVAQISPPPAAVAQTADVPAPIAPTPDAPAVVAPSPDVPVAVAPNANAGAKIDDTAGSTAVEPKVAGGRHPTKAHVSADATNRTVAPESSVDGAKSIAAVPMPAADSGATTDAQEGATSNEPTSPPAQTAESPPS